MSELLDMDAKETSGFESSQHRQLGRLEGKLDNSGSHMANNHTLW